MRLIKTRATVGPHQLGDEDLDLRSLVPATSVESDMNHSPADAGCAIGT